jgi:putative hydrolase of the HAD superfamily
VKTLLWDFDGTLGYRDGIWWAASLLEVLDRECPGYPFTGDQIAPHLRSGFPWHTPERPHTHIASADQWWEELEPLFERVYAALGIETGQARALARQVRSVYCNPARWRLFDDVPSTLDDLSARGWTHVILSNHVPELGEFVSALLLDSRIAAIFNSATLGYEKPHPQIFREALAFIGNGGPTWMIGDNYVADILGAAAVGIPGVLVRKPHDAARCFCADLTGVAAFVENAMA